ncbi:hypothetical protein F7734_19040 [Scytonema sp. UIC 10036]|uniref:hypothetical protein n=1 Tax=Scytonema sp. UIC 10036 TaxID=2304196 RepID=UPI0012DA285A|nr:hypothetical protein [Scytonema sp. UIC 10036]MUG94358.1 hypothetical protein [Scytonema sp. UIC 10036]
MTDFLKFAQQAIQSAAETAAKAGENIGNAASQAGQAVVETAVGVGGAVGSAASQAGQAVVGTAVGVSRNDLRIGICCLSVLRS